MNIIIFSDRKNIKQPFGQITKSRSYTVSFLPASELIAVLKSGQSNTLIYIEISSLKEAERKKHLKTGIKQGGAKIGIIDPDNTITDIAALFHEGIVDYIGKDLLKAGIPAKHFASVYAFCKMDFDRTGPLAGNLPAMNEKRIISGSDWSLVKPGKEYTFCFMFIELDNFREMKKTAGVARAKKIAEAFHNFIANYVSSINGRVWMWMEYTGLILLPFNGTRCDAVLSSFKLMLNRELINSIELSIDYSYSYHIALHIGNTVYMDRGDTGTIVSDSINSVFHLGQKFAENRSLYLTGELTEYIPDKLRDLFVPAGEFEGREILRMRRMI